MSGDISYETKKSKTLRSLTYSIFEFKVEHTTPDFRDSESQNIFYFLPAS